MQNQKPLSEWTLIQVILENLSPLTREALHLCRLSFLKMPLRSTFLINCPNDNVAQLLQCSQLVEIAWAIQKIAGNTTICMYHAKKDIVMRWDGEQLSRGLQ